MRLLPSFFYTLAALGLSACAPEPVSKLQDSNVNELIGDVPEQGRSLFDIITMGRNASGTYEQTVPFPFTELRKTIEAQSQTSALVTVFPKGRSLQRNASDQPFRFPRVVLAVTGEARQTPDSLGILLKDRLYVGYVEAANQLEVISFNAEAGRFEFQLVENYKDGEKAVVKYANRAFCLACHQNASPIFSEAPWDETIANPQIAEKVIQARGSSTYLGIPLKQFQNIPNEIDNATDRANLLGPYQQLWAKGCRTGLAPEQLRCRRLTMELALQYLVAGDYDLTAFEELSALYGKAWPAQFPNGIDLISPDIPNFNPLSTPKGSKDPIFLKDLGLEVNTELQKLAADADIPAVFDPLRDRTHPAWQEWRLEANDSARAIFAFVENVTEADIKLLRKALPGRTEIAKAMDAYATQEQSVLKDASFDRCRWLPEVLRLARSTPVPTCLPTSDPRWPKPAATGTQVVQTNADLQLFFKYCGRCHQDGPLNFLAGASEAAIVASLAKNAGEHWQRLHWEEPQPGHSPMPPAQAREKTALNAAPEDRARMKAFLETLR